MDGEWFAEEWRQTQVPWQPAMEATLSWRNVWPDISGAISLSENQQVRKTLACNIPLRTICALRCMASLVSPWYKSSEVGPPMRLFVPAVFMWLSFAAVWFVSEKNVGGARGPVVLGVFKLTAVLYTLLSHTHYSPLLHLQCSLCLYGCVHCFLCAQRKRRIFSAHTSN